jgi:hypothetical protein
MNRTAIAGVLFVAGLLSCAAGANAQARQEVKYNMVPPQLTVSYQRSYEDYQFLEHDGTLRRIELNGVAAEYAYRRFYPVEIISRASYAAGNPLSQKLVTASAGAGYSRDFAHRYDPFVRVTAGIARTTSGDMQYLYSGTRDGFALNIYGGLDVLVGQRWGVRAIEVQNQYLPYGVQGQGSVYWSVGAGAFFRF